MNHETRMKRLRDYVDSQRPHEFMYPENRWKVNSVEDDMVDQVDYLFDQDSSWKHIAERLKGIRDSLPEHPAVGELSDAIRYCQDQYCEVFHISYEVTETISEDRRKLIYEKPAVDAIMREIGDRKVVRKREEKAKTDKGYRYTKDWLVEP